MTKERTTGNRLASPQDEAIRFLIQLAYTNLGALRPGDLLNLIDGLREHLVFGGSAEAELRKAEKTPAILRPVVEVARQVVEAFANGEQITLPFGSGKMRIDASGPTVNFWIDTELCNRVLLSAWTFLGADQAERIKRCLECKTVFYGQLGQVFCSHRCANKRAAKKYREEHQEERRQKARVAYETRQMAKHGPHVKVERRPKRPSDPLHTQAVQRKGK